MGIIEKELKKNITTRFFILFAAFLMLCNSTSFAQKESSDIHKTKNTVTIKGVKFYLHTVEKGQTLFAISKFYDVSLNDIVIENPEAIDGIKPGQVIRIPAEKKKVVMPTVTTTDTSNYVLHKVETGQTLYSLSKIYNTDIEKIKALNPELKDGLKVGQTLKIPSTKSKSKSKSVIADNKVTTDKNTVTANPVATAKTEPAEKINTTVEYKGETKAEYNIALFLPFNADASNTLDLEKLIKGDAEFSNKTEVALKFYEGALLAIDSLKKLKLNAKVFVYDVDDGDSASIANILKKPELKEMNLIIGPLYGASFMSVAKFAKANQIPIVSPFTQANKILFENPYVCKISPSSTLQVEQMAHFVIDTFATQNVLLVNNLVPKEVLYFNAFKNTANKKLIEKGHAPADSIKEVIGLGGVFNSLNASRVNVIVLPSINQSYVTEFIGKLSTMSDKYKIVIFGMQAWSTYDNLDFEYLNSLQLHIPSNTFIDFTSPSTKKFILDYRNKFNTEPDLQAYQGFDVVYYFASTLQKQGTGFLKNISDTKFSGLETNYSFSQLPTDSGFENKYVFILRYKDYKQVKAN